MSLPYKIKGFHSYLEEINLIWVLYMRKASSIFLQNNMMGIDLTKGIQKIGKLSREALKPHDNVKIIKVGIIFQIQ